MFDMFIYLRSYSEAVVFDFLVPQSTEVPQTQFIRAVRLDEHGLD